MCAETTGCHPKLIYAVTTAALLWSITFALKPLNFWLLMTLNTSILLGWAYLLREKRLSLSLFPSARHWGLGIASAFILWLVFYLGHLAISLGYVYLTGTSAHWNQQILSVYHSANDTPQWLIALLLVFPIASGEEIFWRGTVQRLLTNRYGSYPALLLGTLLYSFIHLPALNPALLIAAVICGLYWGLTYIYTKSIFPGLISHILWDMLIFLIWPIC